MAESMILLVEDNSDHIELAKWTIGCFDSEVRVLCCESAEEARDYLIAAASGGEVCPGLALIDINLPGMSGLELLQWIKTESELPDLKSVMLTTSAAEFDQRIAVASSADGYIVKPLSAEQLSCVLPLVVAG